MFDRIRVRLTLAYVGILAAILLLFGVVVVVRFRDESGRQQDRALVKEAELMAAAVSRGQTMEDIPMSAESEEYASSHLAADGRILFRDPTATDSGLLPAVEAAEEARREGRTVLTTVDGPGGGARIASAPVAGTEGTEGVVQLARSLQADRRTANLLVLVLAPIGLGAVALAGVGGMFVSGRAMRPVRDAFERQRVFVADASHELKTPLALIRADAEVHLRGLTDPDGRALIEDLLGETDRMSAVLSDLLVLARLDAGRLEVARAPFDLASAVCETAERFRARADAEGKRLKITAAADLRARGDDDRTGQILVALLDNALRFTPRGGMVRIVGEREVGRVVVSVIDSGNGISPEHVGRVFDRFYRGEAARTREGGGTGLGLAIARDLARAQGGELMVRRDEGGGALFRLELPQG